MKNYNYLVVIVAILFYESEETGVFIPFFIVWVLLNGKLTWEVVLFGIVISAALYWFCCKFMRYSFARDMDHFKRFGRLLILFFILVREIFKASFALLPYIYVKGREPDPIVASFTSDRVKTDQGRVFLANCITMTPGTITGSLKEGQYLVHCLDRSMAEGLDSSCFVDAIEKWEEN